MKVKQVRFTPLGRPAKVGEWTDGPDGRGHHEFFESIVDMKSDSPNYPAYRREEVEVDVPDPVPEWITRAEDEIPGCGHDCDICGQAAPLKSLIHNTYARYYRAHVEERAKAAAKRYWLDNGSTGAVTSIAEFERVVIEEFTKP